jgi:hypothetical protein
MPITFEQDSARFDGLCTIEEAEPLLAWALAHPSGAVDLATCGYLHCALLQVILATRLVVSAPPADIQLAGLLSRSAFNVHPSGESDENRTAR